LIWQIGIDVALVTSVLAFLLLGTTAARAIVGVARAARAESSAVQAMTTETTGAARAPRAGRAPRPRFFEAVFRSPPRVARSIPRTRGKFPDNA
jgi:hypothetical protein